MITFFTSISFSYLNRARILGATIKKHHPDSYNVLVISDVIPEGFNFDVEDEDWDEVIWAHELDIPDIYGWLFRHQLVEICTAVKGPVLEHLARTRGGKIIYLDPDIAIFNPLDEIINGLDDYDVILTPHQVAAESERYAILDNEVSSLKHGTYNLGFVAINSKDQGLEFANWWSERLKHFCFDDIPMGIFVDQKWCDLVPAYFDRVWVNRNVGHNVASWNISNRKLSVNKEGGIRVNDVSDLIFYHFTKAGPVGDAMTQKYAGNNLVVFEIWKWYMKELHRNTSEGIPDRYWHYGNYSNGEPVKNEHRYIYRNNRDLQQYFKNPFESEVGNPFYSWLIHNNNL